MTRTGLVVVAGIAAACVALFLAWTPPPELADREVARLTTATPVGEGPELAGRVERRLASAEQRLAESREQVLNL